MPPTNEPILFLWSLSAWASKITAYMALRKIPYSRCEQPITLPRPDLTALGVRYRRIPLLSCGLDIYCDTLLILQKLESLYPENTPTHKKISADTSTEKALEYLFEKWTDTVVFKSAAATISSDLDLMQDPKFQSDREALWGRPWDKATQDSLRPSALAEMRENFEFLENVLSDGRTWILGRGTEEKEGGPTLADIHAAWIFDWLGMLPGSFPEEEFNARKFPGTVGWLGRYKTAIEKAKESAPKPTELESVECVDRILNSGFEETELEVEENDLSGLKAGDEIKMAPVDTGFGSSDVGKLIGLKRNEVTISSLTQQGGKEIHIHYPRWNFSFEKI
ncbi:uncharacterized protein MYCFIDRAFT_28695 [Pseudocercospora fijiensis CIRAD86]|uniref:GST C-terminal domain-containing protein n=1 Tax=Pseudocercospora fijiensis (strain CIRAD86) TaxID=383855 RepID=N1Q5Q6_PSEFD|nr:uncharacterized protein MYCFIDRAFT_28695 [Pseudocercospora fijiensis CIRAD86]EME87274.1 hypothetical protein MYCFIDRAFT_28695 [Pseudocercospora fijiensis CIRAD86]